MVDCPMFPRWPTVLGGKDRPIGRILDKENLTFNLDLLAFRPICSSSSSFCWPSPMDCYW